jgi:hypothetical protein
VHQGRSIWLGSHTTLAEAAAARRKAEDELFDPAFRRVEPRELVESLAAELASYAAEPSEVDRVAAELAEYVAL